MQCNKRTNLGNINRSGEPPLTFILLDEGAHHPKLIIKLLDYFDLLSGFFTSPVILCSI